MPNPNNDNIIRDDNPLKNRNNNPNDNEILRDRDDEIENFEDDYWKDEEEEKDEEIVDGEEVDPLDEVVLELDDSELAMEEALDDKKDDKKKKKKKYEDWDYETYADKDTYELNYDVYANKVQENGSQGSGVHQPTPQQTPDNDAPAGFVMGDDGRIHSVNYEDNVAKAHDIDQSATLSS